MQINPSPVPPKGKGLLDQVRDAISTKHYSYRTEQTYVDYIELRQILLKSCCLIKLF